uniref:Uncharacterized protein n=1 Tax=Onchocerca volvulus TaxID=6282 RepID=A0A8R1XY23_ONCVO
MLSRELNIFKIIFIDVILFHLCVRAEMASFSSTGSISPKVGSIPALANTKIYEETLREFVVPTTSFLVDRVLQKNASQSFGRTQLS